MENQVHIRFQSPYSNKTDLFLNQRLISLFLLNFAFNVLNSSFIAWMFLFLKILAIHLANLDYGFISLLKLAIASIWYFFW